MTFRGVAAGLGWLVATGGLTAGGCEDEQPPLELVLDGPARVQVDRLGPVVPPRVAWSDGTEAEVVWSADASQVAVVEDGRIHAQGPGEAELEGTVDGQAVRWTLVVEPLVALTFIDPPETLSVGSRAELEVTGLLGERHVDPGALHWTSTPTSVVTVDERGVVRGISSGVAWVTVSGTHGDAMIELVVRR